LVVSTHLKNMLVKLEIIPMFRGENKKYVKRPASYNRSYFTPFIGRVAPPCRLYSVRTLCVNIFLSCQETRFAAVWEAKLHETQRWLALPLKYLISLNPKKSTKLSQEKVIATLEVQISYLLNGVSAKTIVLLF